MAGLRAQRSPLRRRRPVHVLDLVERVLDVGLEVGPRLHVRALQRVAGVDGQHRLGVHVLAPEQELVQAEAVGRAIAPRRHVAGALRKRPERLLPIEAVGDLIALEIVAAGEPQELRLHVDEHLQQVGPEAVRPGS